MRSLLILLFFSLLVGTTTDAFVPSPSATQRSAAPLFSQEPESANGDIFDRFTNPTIDDPRLPLTEAGLAQIVAPSLQLFWLSAANSAFPSWAAPILSDISYWDTVPRGSFLAPTLIHGAGLACCWVLGTLASEGYKRSAYEGDAATIFVGTAKAGAFAVGCLVLATQFDLYRDMGGYFQVGDSVETDMRIYRALVELINDCFFEGIVMLSWRFYRSAAARYGI